MTSVLKRMAGMPVLRPGFAAAKKADPKVGFPRDGRSAAYAPSCFSASFSVVLGRMALLVFSALGTVVAADVQRLALRRAQFLHDPGFVVRQRLGDAGANLACRALSSVCAASAWAQYRAR